ncbi:MAG: flagellar hook-basal body complex protein [Lachnospiraceae bacterium]|nr:flagellar hook-basal body complex protein [Lachnospiraceae bacterium]
MMRSMYSGVAGLKTHQTKMDVIGNNIANVNTVAFKSQSVTFSELMYQTTQNASGANATTGTAGINARQIGLGVKTGAINTAISSQGASQTTNNPFDIRITGSSFFVVSNGQNNYFTRDGSFYVDGLGNLAMTSNGYNVMGWQVDPATMDIKQDTVTPLRIMSAENMTYAPEATSKARVAGIIDKLDTNITSSSGKNMNLMFYDNLGYSYTAKINLKSTLNEGQFAVSLTDIVNSDNVSLKDVYNVDDISDIVTFGSTQSQVSSELIKLTNGYSYDSTTTPPVFKHVTSPEAAFADYKTTRMPGVSYTFPDGDQNAAATVVADGTATLDKNTLETEYKLVYLGGGKYYYEDSASNPVTGKTIPDDETWETFLGGSYPNATNITATDNGDGSITLNFKQNFTVGSQNINITGGLFTETLDATDINNKIAAYGISDAGNGVSYDIDVAPNGQAQITRTQATPGYTLYFDTDTGKFMGIGGQGKENTSVTLDFAALATAKNGESVPLENFSDISIDFSATSMFNNSGTSTVAASNGDADKIGSGRKLGQMSGVSIQDDGRIYASYDNGMSRLLGQIAVAEFPNASGLEKEGDNLYKASQNSGDFDGIGIDIKSGGGYMTTGVLEMSNVDLSAEFTDMITTQRGFQANSRIITVSDTLLEELVNLKR